ncbi:DUF7504 family protein [Natronomonas marina]|jgi:hypothetical protein|uniref:DUF7504 family protein n=1 Tax=Natronomonas marina TaxID=2961939 RepID=UPI0020C97C32|nr:hypothetical protein [Natronomonas marina]
MSAGESVGDLIDRPSSADLEDASNVLVLATSLDERARESYYRTLFPDQPSTVDVLAVDYRQTPDQYLDEWRRYADGKPRRCGIICVGESTRGPGDASDIDGNAVACVENPGDLTGVGIKVGNYLDGYGGPETVVTFDSLTVLLQYVELERAFRFLHVLSNQVRSMDAVAHYHIDPEAHDDQVLATLSSLFDAVARFDDGDWEIRSR